MLGHQTITYSPPPSSRSANQDIVLRQKEIPEGQQNASLSDMSRMWAYVIAGRSARSYLKEGCPIEVLGGGRVAVPLDFYVWPPAMNCRYSLSAEMGSISRAIMVEEPVEFDVVFGLDDSVDFDYLLEGDLTFETPFINAVGDDIAQPDFTISGRTITADSKVFCVARFSGVAIGYKHTVTVEFDVVVDSHITSLNNAIIATWTKADGTTGSTGLDIVYPQCVTEFLELCPDGLEIVGGGVRLLKPVVYYCGCTGEFMEQRYEWK